MAKKKTGIPKWAGSGQYIPITYDMMKSDAWRALTVKRSKAISLYLYMRTHFKGIGVLGEVARKYPNVAAMQRDDIFFFPKTDAEKSGLYQITSGHSSGFYRDVRTLEELGFIQTVAKGGRGRMAVYQFSEAWKVWKPKPP